MHSPQLLVFKDRAFKTDELELIHEVVDSCPRLSRQELANTVCELLGWRRANGGLKTWECKQLLEHLEQARGLGLPPLRETKPRGVSRRLPDSAAGEAGEVLRGRLREVAPVQLSLVEQPRERRLWRELVDRYHYLGYKMAFGARLQYLVQVQRPRPQVVACVQFSSPAWRMAARDHWIGWEEATRRSNLQKIVNQSRFLILPWIEIRNLASHVLSHWIGWEEATRRSNLQKIVNQSRFLILPWIEIRNLASHVLSQLTGRVSEDWQQHYGLRPLLLETLVDAERYQGTCYRAANWQWLGQTSGRGRMDRRHQHRAGIKQVFVYPLVGGAREALRQKGSPA